MRPRAERQSGDEAASDALYESAARYGGGRPLDEHESDDEHHAEHVGEREPRLEPEQRRQRHDEGGAQGHRPIGVPPFQDVEHRGDGGRGQGRDESERGRMIGNDGIGELSGCDIDRIAGRMRPMLGDIEIVEAEGKVHRVPIVEPMRAREGEQRGQAEEQERCGQRVLC